jgi:hypothetical protein
MRYAAASAACISAVMVLLLVRGASDWSGSFALCWYGLLAAAVILALRGVFAATRSATWGQRALAIALSLPALLAVPVFIWLVFALVRYAN